ncbi:MAG: CBS domain-containing protein [Polyangiaceae bacterium]
MTRTPQTISVNASLAGAIDTLQSLRVRHLPVVDDEGIIVGMISDRDLGSLMKTFIAGAEVDEMPDPPETRSLTELMSTDPITVQEDTDVTEIIDTLVDERIGAVPVVDSRDRVVGIISYVDILVALRPKESGSAERRTSKAPVAPRPRPSRST